MPNSFAPGDRVAFVDFVDFADFSDFADFADFASLGGLECEGLGFGVVRGTVMVAAEVMAKRARDLLLRDAMPDLAECVRTELLSGQLHDVAWELVEVKIGGGEDGDDCVIKVPPVSLRRILLS